MSITVDSSAFSPSSQVQLVQLNSEQSEISALSGVAPRSASAPFGPAATVTLSAAAQSVLDGQVSSLELSSLEQSDGIDASAVAKLAAQTASPGDAGFDPADPFGDGSS